MEKTESKAKYVGELAAVLFLEIIMLLFRLVQPIRWPSQVPAAWQTAGNELIFFGIEFILMIVVVGHFIFRKSYKALGLTGFKENIGSLILNLCFVAVCVGGAFVTSQFSKLVEFDAMQIGLKILVNFIAIASMSELLYRGLIFSIFLQLTKGKGIVASLLTACLFALSYVPSLFINLNEVSASTLLGALVGPYLFGLYLSLLYFYGKNLWMCIIIHGVALTFTIFEPDFVMTALAVIYGVSALIYLGVKVISCNKQAGEKDLDDEEINEISYEGSSEEVSQVDEFPTSHIEALNHLTDFDISEKSNQKIEEDKDSSNQEIEEDKDTLNQVNRSDLAELSSLEDGSEKESEYGSENKVIEIPNFIENMSEDRVEDSSNQEEIDESEYDHDEEDDLEKVAAIPNTEEEMGKVVNLQARKEKLVRNGRKDINFDDTIIIPHLSEEQPNSERKSTFNLKDTEQIVEAEPNFIAHLEEYLGEFEGIYKQVEPTDPSIDIMYFVGEEYHAIVTNGMRTLPMAVPPELSEYSRAELMMFIDPSMIPSGQSLQSKGNAWMVKLLTDLALYPRETGSYLGWGHIVGNGEYLESYDETVEYCGALIYPPMDQKDVKFYRYMEKGQNIYIYNVMPLYAEELKFVQEHSGEQFVNLMSQMGIRQSVKKNRVNLIEELKR